MQISVIIPALDEAESIVHVLASIPREQIIEILVIDGGSRDGTVNLAQQAGAKVILEPRRGYGRACARGAAAAQGDILVFLDADGADDLQRLADLVSPILDGAFDMVLGSRLAGKLEPGAMPWHQQVGNKLAALCIRWLYGLPVTDMSPFRAVRRESLLDLRLEEMTYGWPTEMIVKASRRGWRICEVPVSCHRRLGGKSKISGTFRGTVFATWLILSTIFRYTRW